MAFKLSDDGTLDTVVTCEDCGEEVRYNYGYDAPKDLTYDEWVEWCLKDAAEDHECDRSWCDSDQEEVSDVK
jgi:RNase P subunit RPR2